MMITCPQCRKETAWEENPFRPFCSDRCRLLDLGKWATGEYRIEGEARPQNGDDQEEK